MLNNKSVGFFETQFQRQVRDQEYALNPFEILALDYLKGSVLDLGCGLGNLSLEAGRRGHHVVAVDASPTAIARLNNDAEREGLPVRGIQADVENWTITESYETIVVIGLLMFFRHEAALKLLTAIQKHVKPEGRAIVNVLIEGTTYLECSIPIATISFDGPSWKNGLSVGIFWNHAPRRSLRLRNAQGFFDPNRGETESKELKTISTDW